MRNFYAPGVMIERRACRMEPSMRPLVPLREAAALAFERLFPDQADPDPKLLGIVAFALSALVAVYRRDVRSGELCEVAEAEFTAREFSRAIDLLFIPAQQLERALPTFQLRPLEAATRVSLTLRQSRRP